jgi:glycosyltransferase involved in cell wall biosynthesis
MVVGVTIVATDVGGNSEAIEHGVSGLIVPSEDSKALGDAIVTLANDRAKRLEYSTAAAERARVHFSLNTCVDRYDQLYIEILENR